jgi:hypothetical protein
MQQTIQRFPPILLQEMERAGLMERQDTKFALPQVFLPELLKTLLDDYRVLEVQGVRSNHYRSLYFDTPDYAFFRAHHNKALNRVKVRYRLYADSGLCFFEVKQKNNRRRTEKSRIQVEAPAMALRGPELRFLAEKTGMDGTKLQPALWVEYNRTTLVRKDLSERLTLDTELRFWSPDREKIFELPGLAILELKQGRATRQSPVADSLRTAHIRPLSVSKYCFAAMGLGFPVKYNLFKTKLLRLSKLVNDDTLRQLAHAAPLDGHPAV